MVHSCVLGLVGEPDWESELVPPSPAINRGFLWLARWPPRAWNDGNCRLQVLHSKTRVGDGDGGDDRFEEEELEYSK